MSKRNNNAIVKNNIDDHSTQVGKMIEIAKGTRRKITDYKLPRYACYLIVQNVAPKKEVVALGQTYIFCCSNKKTRRLVKKNIVS